MERVRHNDSSVVALCLDNGQVSVRVSHEAHGYRMNDVEVLAK